MKKHIKIYKVSGKYRFAVNKFSSVHHSKFTKFVSPEYRYAWQAFDDAQKLAEKKSYHIDALEKFAMEDLKTPVIVDVASEILVADHYDEIYDGLVDTASGMDKEDEKQKEINYLEAKSVVSEILFLMENMNKDELADEENLSESKSRLSKILSNVKDLVHKYYKNELNNDKKENEEKESLGMGQSLEAPLEDVNAPLGQMPMASSDLFLKVSKFDKDELDKDLIIDMLDEYGRMACRSIEDRHPSVIWKIKDSSVELKDGNDVIIVICIDDNLLLEDIKPSGRLQKVFPYNSLKFYQAYWKPIVEGVGHCCVDDGNSILVLGDKVLPDISKEIPFDSYEIEAIRKNSKDIVPYMVSFKGDDPSWFIEPCKLSKSASSMYNKEDYYQNGKGAIVICTDPTLKSYYGKTGQVIQLVPFDDHLEVDINFGNHICRMVEDQFKIIDGL